MSDRDSLAAAGDHRPGQIPTDKITGNLRFPWPANVALLLSKLASRVLCFANHNIEHLLGKLDGMATFRRPDLLSTYRAGRNATVLAQYAPWGVDVNQLA